MSRWGETRVVASNKNTDATVSVSEMKKEKVPLYSLKHNLVLVNTFSRNKKSISSNHVQKKATPHQ